MQRNKLKPKEEAIICVKVGKKSPFLRITVCYHSVSTMVTNGDTWDGFVYPNHTLMNLRKYQIKCISVYHGTFKNEKTRK